jgi:hypothetical protein
MGSTYRQACSPGRRRKNARPEALGPTRCTILMMMSVEGSTHLLTYPITDRYTTYR